MKRRRLLPLLAIAVLATHGVACGDPEPEPVPEWDHRATVLLEGRCARVGTPALLDPPRAAISFTTYVCPRPTGDGPQGPAVDFGCGGSSESPPCRTPAPASRPKAHRITQVTCTPDCTARVVPGAFGERVEVLATREVEAEVEMTIELTDVTETTEPLRSATRAVVSFQTDGRCDVGGDLERTPRSDAGP